MINALSDDDHLRHRDNREPHGDTVPLGAEQGNEGEGEEGDEDSQLPGGDPAFRYI